MGGDPTKILFLDIETSPNIAAVWGLFKQNIGIAQLRKSSKVICWSAKWHRDRRIMFDSVFKSPSRKMIRNIHKLLNEADVVVHYNGKAFDIPILNKEFVLRKLKPPSPYKQIDLYCEVKDSFQFTSHKLEYVVQQLKIGVKVPHIGHELWLQCMARNEQAWRTMERYNKRDVILAEKLYERLLPWIKQHPNYALYMDIAKPACINCGSTNIRREGIRRTKVQAYQRFVCKDCGSWMRGRSTIVPKHQRKNILSRA